MQAISYNPWRHLWIVALSHCLESRSPHCCRLLYATHPETCLENFRAGAWMCVKIAQKTQHCNTHGCVMLKRPPGLWYWLRFFQIFLCNEKQRKQRGARQQFCFKSSTCVFHHVHLKTKKPLVFVATALAHDGWLRPFYDWFPMLHRGKGCVSVWNSSKQTQDKSWSCHVFAGGDRKIIRLPLLGLTGLRLKRKSSKSIM